MSPRDRVEMLAALGVRVALSRDGQRLRLSGIALAINTAIPTLHQHRTELVINLRGAMGDALRGSMSLSLTGQRDTCPAMARR